MMGVNLERMVARLQRMSTLSSGLRALLHWWREYSERLERGRGDVVELEQAGWCYGAMIQQADVLFTSDRSGSKQRCAAMRALENLDRGDLKTRLDDALAVPATENGRPLRDVIRRMRNEMMVHTSFDFDEYGPGLVFLGLQGQDLPNALTGLMRTTESVDLALREEVASAWREVDGAGSMAAAFEMMKSAPQRVASEERSRRRPRTR